jgi:DNA polymerase delta subunit 4
MPPKRRSTGGQPKSQQSTLAFHNTSSNKVTKPGVRTSSTKNLLTETAKKSEKPDVADLVVQEEEEPTTAEAAIIEQTEQVQQQAQSTPEEEEARKITAKRIQAYWKLESQSQAPRAHQKDLSLDEKILRKFDMSGQYGVSKTSMIVNSFPC